MKASSIHKLNAAYDTVCRERDELLAQQSVHEQEKADLKAKLKAAEDKAAELRAKIEDAHGALSAKLASFGNDIGSLLSWLKR